MSARALLHIILLLAASRAGLIACTCVSSGLDHEFRQTELVFRGKVLAVKTLPARPRKVVAIYEL
jgi:hypothetical protein